MKAFTSTIISNVLLAKQLFKIEFEWHDDVGVPLPGQFVTIRLLKTSIPLLRRPFALSEVDVGLQRAAFIYQKRGVATEILSGKKPGDALDVIGPLGNHFLEKQCNSNTALVVAGGIGLGPMLFCESWLKSLGKEVLFIFGCKDSHSLPDCILNSNRIICTDDGSYGYHGTVVDYLEQKVSRSAGLYSLFACGPLPMLKACHEFGMLHAFPCSVSVEQIMACGVGACMGCVIPLSDGTGNARVCKEGPVFDSKVIQWK